MDCEVGSLCQLLVCDPKFVDKIWVLHFLLPKRQMTSYNYMHVFC